MEREASARSADRSRGLAAAVGRRLSPASRVLPRPSGTRRKPRHRTRSCPGVSVSGRRTFTASRAANPGRTSENPFVGTTADERIARSPGDARQLGSQGRSRTRIYTLKEPVEGARRWYVARDLGQTFGRTGMIDPPRGDIEVFEQTPFIKGVEDGFVRFDYRGRHKALVDAHPPGRRAMDLRAPVGADRHPVAGRVSCRGLPQADRRPLHPPSRAEDRRRPCS